MDITITYAFIALAGVCIGYGLRSITAYVEESRNADIVKDAFKYIKSDNMNQFTQAKIIEKQLQTPKQEKPKKIEPANSTDGLRALDKALISINEKTGNRYEVI